MLGRKIVSGAGANNFPYESTNSFFMCVCVHSPLSAFSTAENQGSGLDTKGAAKTAEEEAMPGIASAALQPHAISLATKPSIKTPAISPSSIKLDEIPAHERAKSLVYPRAN